MTASASGFTPRRISRRAWGFVCRISTRIVAVTRRPDMKSRDDKTAEDFLRRRLTTEFCSPDDELTVYVRPLRGSRKSIVQFALRACNGNKSAQPRLWASAATPAPEARRLRRAACCTLASRYRRMRSGCGDGDAPSAGIRLGGFVALVTIAGVAARRARRHVVAASPFDYGWLALALLTWVSGTFAVWRFPATTATIPVSEVFVFRWPSYYGGPEATVTVAVDGLLTSLPIEGTAAPAVCCSTSSSQRSRSRSRRRSTRGCLAFHRYRAAPAPLTALVMPVFVLASYLLLNTWLTASVMALESSRSPIHDLAGNTSVWLSGQFLSGASIALLLSVNMRRQVSVQAALVLPLVFLLYLVFRTWTERVRDAGAHVATIDRLHLSTVEALAIASNPGPGHVDASHAVCRTLSLAIAKHPASRRRADARHRSRRVAA